MAPEIHSSVDPRVARTRRAIFGAFAELVLQRPYSSLRVEDILEHSGVSRSTFYQHFDGKDDLLVRSMDVLLGVLADSAKGGPSPKLVWVLEHFWENRRYAEAILGGSAGETVVAHLEQLIYERCAAPSSTLTARRLTARLLAHGQLGVVRQWLRADDGVSVQEVARVLSSVGVG